MNAEDWLGSTALLDAVRGGAPFFLFVGGDKNAEIVKALLDAGADVTKIYFVPGNEGNDEEGTILRFARGPRVKRLLKDAGAEE